ncbi:MULTISPECIES: purine-cytosine permease family protein [Kitasatospora]|uniref:purine-cytosine permease family protein n=1 Tax=Kitasatospora TaxID=2063 RepID=UPI000C70FADC|nr:cytosine permease [Kitasatospora sp. GP30]MDH6138121.1 NCS1 family nucleobase:cation symporter-1 [Kitasatospora sp. GP30]
MTAASPSPASTAVLQDAPPVRAEAPLVLDTAPPRTLGFRDQFALWANLGISLIGFTTASTVLGAQGQELSITAATTAIVLGTVIGTAMLAVAALIGARTGAPAMAVLRGLFGTRLSYLPTVLNVLQCVGWGIYELLVISSGAQTVVGTQGWHWLFVLVAGTLTTVLTIWPLGSITALRKYVAVAVAVAMVYFTVQLGRHHIPNPGAGNWHGFPQATDAIIAISVSFVPMAADYTRHSRTARASFWGTFSGYTIAQVWCYLLGLIALLQAKGNVDNLLTSFTGVTAGWAFLLVLVLREADQSFANVYSTAMSLHNLLPRVDRRWLTAGIGVLVTAVATQINQLATWYSNFLYLIGSVFVPLLAVLAVDYFLGRGRRQGWALTQDAPSRPLLLLPWVLGFATYQYLSPTPITTGWTAFWTRAQSLLHYTPGDWTSASLYSFLVAGLATWALTRAVPKA